jgi:biopolymer transport protein ExbB/TolQ
MEVGWFTSDLCLTIGMVGTVVGFIMMLSGFATVNIADVKTVQSLIRELGVGMSTALYTTLTGLICGALLKIQYFNLNQAIDRIQKNEEKLSH